MQRMQEMLNLPSISSAKEITINTRTISVQSAQKDGNNEIEAKRNVQLFNPDSIVLDAECVYK